MTAAARVSLVFSLFACLLLLLPVAQARAAADQSKEEVASRAKRPPTNPEAPSSADLRSGAGQQGDVSTNQAIGSGCHGYTDRPHYSLGSASVHGRTECPFVADIIASVNLYRLRWYGWQHLANGYDAGVTSRVNGNARWYCSGTGTYTYLGETYHRATIGGTNYTAYTSHQARFGC